MKQIPKDFIFELVARTNIVDIISERVKIKKKGNNYFGCCPFHNEKTPSFSVNDKKQIFYCFGCGASGSVIDFFMEFDRFTFVETIEELANLQGLTVPYVKTNNTKHKNIGEFNERASLYTLTSAIAHFYHEKLYSTDGNNARDYLHQRGLNDAVIKRFNIGYAPASWQETYRFIAKKDKEKQLYKQAGMLVTTTQENYYDRFRDRIMFPIRDRRGNTIAFGGRTIKKDNEIKYLNSPETVIFHKGRQLYGLYEALEQNRNPETLLVVEGYMDVITLAQFGLDYAVAALGTATTEEHIKLLFRTTDAVTFCYDGDTAGKRAAWRALTTLLPAMIDGKEIKFIFLPENEDPDTLIRKEGKVAFESRIQHAEALSSFLFRGLLRQADISTAEGKAKLSNLAIPLINRVQAVNFNHSLRRKLGDYLGLLDSLQINALFNPDQTADNMASVVNKSIKIKLTTMRILVGLLLQYPQLAKLVTDIKHVEHSKLTGKDTFLKLLTICYKYPDITTAQMLLEFSRDEDDSILPYLKELAVWEHRYDDDQVPIIFKNTLKALYDNILADRQESLIGKARLLGLSDQEKKELTTLLVLLKKG